MPLRVLSPITDTISLTLSPHHALTSVATLVAGGIGGRLAFPVDRIDDLQIAITTVLGGAGAPAEATLEFTVEPTSVECLVGPVDPDVKKAVSVLRRLVSEADLTERNGSTWVRLRLDAPVRAAAAS